MPTEVLMPDLGQTTSESTIVRWLKSPGDPIKRGEPLVEVQTDKAVVEVEAAVAGTLSRVLAAEGEVIRAGTSIAEVVEPGGDLTGGASGSGQPTPGAAGNGHPTSGPTAAAPAEPASLPGRERATPRARKLAADKGVDLRSIRGTGPGGRIRGEDVDRSLAEQAAAAPPGSAPSPAVSAPLAAAAGQPTSLSPMRQAIARHMTLSKQTIPHLYLVLEADMAEAVKLRQQLLDDLGEAGPRVSFTHIVVCAVARALREHPNINCTTDGATLTVLDEVNVGIAVDVEDGLIVPVLRGADRLPLLQIAARAIDLVARARDKRLSRLEAVGGTFTVTNLGMHGIEEFHAIVNPPEGAILALGAIADRPVALAGQAVVRPTMRLALSCDHRAIDGARAARFLGRVRQLLERPYLLLVERPAGEQGNQRLA